MSFGYHLFLGIHIFRIQGFFLVCLHYISLFRYAWSPLVVEYKAQYYSLYGAITNIIAYCGGMFTTVQVLHRAYLGGSAFIKDNMYKKL